MIDLTTFYLILYFTNLTGRVARTTSDLVDLSAVPPKYHKFANIFDKAKAETLALYYLYDWQIKLENKEKLSIGTIYLLSTAEQEVSKEFIYKNLNTGFIHPISFPHRAFILFVKKKDSSFLLWQPLDTKSNNHTRQ